MILLCLVQNIQSNKNTKYKLKAENIVIIVIIVNGEKKGKSLF